MAAEHEVPLVPRGAGTGLSGGAVAVDGAISVQRGARHVAAMRAIKTALDPQGILNPGKIFPD